jgi:membrane protein insertase Oxa1/YidC/SpoIIIJ
MPQPFWYSDPSVLFTNDTWYVFVPTPAMTVPEALNAVVRFSVYLSGLLFLTSLDPWYILLIPVVMGITLFLNAWFPHAKKMTESFVSSYVGTD